MTSPPALNSYLTAASEAERDGIEEHKAILLFVEELDALYRRLVTGPSHSEHPAAGFLAMQSHANFLAAISTALRGQSPQTFMILRGCVESAMYAFLIGLDKDDGTVWTKRTENPAAAKAKFTANRAIQLLDPRDPNLAVLARDSYQWMIEFGGHPNPRSVIDHIRHSPEDEQGYMPVSMVYLHASDSAAVMRALSACVENACMSIAIVKHAMPKHPDGVAVFTKTWEIFHSFQRHLADEGYITDSSRSDGTD